MASKKDFQYPAQTRLYRLHKHKNNLDSTFSLFVFLNWIRTQKWYITYKFNTIPQYDLQSYSFFKNPVCYQGTYLILATCFHRILVFIEIDTFILLIELFNRTYYFNILLLIFLKTFGIPPFFLWCQHDKV